MDKNWVCTDIDNQQYGRRLSRSIFEFKEKSRDLDEYDEGEEIQLLINLDDYSTEQIDDYISGYYQDINEIQNIYGTESSWIIAECIFEQESGLY